MCKTKPNYLKISKSIFSSTRRGRGCWAFARARAHRRSAKCVRLLAERTEVTGASDYDSDNGKSSLNTWNVSLKVVDDRTNPFGEARYRYTLDLCPISWEKKPSSGAFDIKTSNSLCHDA